MTDNMRVVELERKVNTLAKVIDVFLLKGEKVSNKEMRELKSRLDDWTSGKKSDFVKLEDAIHGV